MLRSGFCRLVLALCFGTAAMLSLAQGAPAPEAGVVKITSQRGGVPRGGTGFIVNLGPDAAYIVTAAHVVEGDTRPTVKFFASPFKPFPATVENLEGGEADGLALLRVEGTLPEGLVALVLGETEEIGNRDDIEAIGIPRQIDNWSVIPGQVVARQGRKIFFSANIDEGNSGGPLVKQGRVVGLVIGTTGRFGQAVLAGSVELYLEGLGVPWKPALTTQKFFNRLGMQVKDLSPEQDIQGVEVVSVKDEGPAALGGVRSGDIIITLNQKPVANVAEFEELVKNLPTGNAFPILIQRGNEKMFLPLRPLGKE